MDNVFSFFMCALRYRVARRLAGSGALYWRRREFGYPSQSRVDPTRQSSTRPGPRAAPGCGGLAEQPFDLSVAARQFLCDQNISLFEIKTFAAEAISAMSVH
jgi:hypothetical protein